MAVLLDVDCEEAAVAIVAEVVENSGSDDMSEEWKRMTNEQRGQCSRKSTVQAESCSHRGPHSGCRGVRVRVGSAVRSVSFRERKKGELDVAEGCCDAGEVCVVVIDNELSDKLVGHSVALVVLGVVVRCLRDFVGESGTDKIEWVVVLS